MTTNLHPVRYRIHAIGVAGGLAMQLLPTLSHAQVALEHPANPMTSVPTAPPAVAHPTYVTLSFEQVVDRPASKVWARVGKFCDIGEWSHVNCIIISGTDGQLGAIRNVAGGFIEMLVGRTELSYTYAQPVRAGVPYNSYHATLEAKRLTSTSSKLVYSFFYDNSVMANDAARDAELANRRKRIPIALLNMKALSEQSPREVK